MSGARIRQKFAKKRSLHGVNEHFSQIFNAIIVPRSNRAKVSESLILLRTLLHEEVPDKDERGVRVSLENDEFDEEDRNVLVEMQIENDKIVIRSTFRKYALDVSGIEREDVEEMIRLVRKQNYDNRFRLRIA
jgi:hypothetical protein